MSEQTKEEMREELRQEIEAKYIAEVQTWKEQQDAQNREIITRTIKELTDEYKPVSAQDIQHVLEQEYVTFSVKLMIGGSQKEFSICELPQSKELKFYRKLKDLLLTKIKDVVTLTTGAGLIDGQFETKVAALAEMIDPSFDLLSDLAALALNDSSITKEWVQENLASYRIWNIVWAQIEVNKVRDFFSQASRASSGRMIKGVVAQK